MNLLLRSKEIPDLEIIVNAECHVVSIEIYTPCIGCLSTANIGFG